MKFKSLVVALLFVIAAFPSAIFCQTNPSDTAPKPNYMVLQHTRSFSLSYLNKFAVTKGSLFDNTFKNGNNFTGITISHMLKLAEGISLKPEAKLQFGTINGKFASTVMVQPNIMMGSKSLNFTAGAGLAMQSIKNNTAELGGFGVCSSIGFDVHIIGKLSLFCDIGYENYQNASYNSFALGICYLR